MEKLDFQSIADNKERFQFNDQMALFSDFGELRSRAIPDVLIDGFLFAVVTNGQAQLSMNDRNYLLKAGDVITCKPRIIFERSMVSIDFNALVLFLSPDYMERLSQLIRMEWAYSLFSPSHKIMHADENSMRRYCLYFDLLKSHLSSPDTPHKEQSLRMLFASMACDYHDLQKFQDDEGLRLSYSSSENILRRFMELLHDPSQPYLKVNEYARLFHISPKYLSSICRRFTGKTANLLITDEIVRSAQIFLRDSNKTVKQIAELLGFRSHSHFGSFFRRHTGVTPHQFREEKLWL